MYLTSFEINTRRAGSRRLLVSRQRMHAAILQSFSQEQLGDGRVLWRLDHGLNGRVELLIVSPGKPDLAAMVEEAGWPSTTSWRTADYSGFLGRLQEGQTWRFRLTANPVKNVRTEPGKRGKPVPLTGDARLQWLLRQGPKLGASFGDEESPTADITRRDLHRFRRGTDEQRNTVDLTTAQFDGLLEVTDPTLLRGALINGVGRAKGYGCGLLTLAPAR